MNTKFGEKDQVLALSPFNNDETLVRFNKNIFQKKTFLNFSGLMKKMSLYSLIYILFLIKIYLICHFLNVYLYFLSFR